MEKLDILVVGGGGREHAIIKKLSESKQTGKLYCAPGNGGISREAKCYFDVKADDIDAVLNLAKELDVDLVFVAPDDPLVAGMVDVLIDAGFSVFGPKKNAAIIEGSKVFSKNLMKKYNIPTGDYKVFDNPEKALTFIKNNSSYPTVVKADGLALGKGVIICENFEEAQDAVKSIMKDKIFGSSGNNIIIEEFLTGPEVSVLAFTDGKTVVPMVSSMDHKRVFDGDMGPNTGGMGTISPNPYYTSEIADFCMKKIFDPTVKAMNSEGRTFKGCLFFGLMITKAGPKVIEYNCRFGDPEAQVVLPRLKTDLVDILCAIDKETLSSINIEWDKKACACVVMASGGYPAEYQKGLPISGLDEEGQRKDSIIFHAGTIYKNNHFYTNGGRVIGVTSNGLTVDEALKNTYSAVSKIDFEDAHFRKDIGRT